MMSYKTVSRQISVNIKSVEEGKIHTLAGLKDNKLTTIATWRTERRGQSCILEAEPLRRRARRGPKRRKKCKECSSLKGKVFDVRL